MLAGAGTALAAGAVAAAKAQERKEGPPMTSQPLLYVGVLESDRARDRQFWACLWQGRDKPRDIRIRHAFNLMTNTRVIVFEASTTEAQSYFDRFNLVGKWAAHPSLDQTIGYQAAIASNPDPLGPMYAQRGLGQEWIDRLIAERRRYINAPSVDAALKMARTTELSY
jgi:hypothetical protein